MTCENPEHAALESELNDALEEALQMEERLAAYEAAGADNGAARGVHAAKTMEDITVLTEQVANLEKERDGYEQDYLNQKDRVNELETQLEDKDHKTKDLVSFRLVWERISSSVRFDRVKFCLLYHPKFTNAAALGVFSGAPCWSCDTTTVCTTPTR